ncbi:tail fiber protein [Rhodanobacter sp. C01]|uniref:phage tail protein n=1 Tax=Rhodanobacter sp. C01 TaxID=1945856 RepID=UPI0009855759|nr:tail fiber protein [Rhodanobacter sp. C01]OOG50916.1 microcystin-dependent protein [Rhodanobacter sp. C01]
MTTPFVGEIQVFGFNFAPYQWTQCNGATLPISQNTALYSLIGVNYGGNGTTTFQVPNLAARGACNQGNGPGLTPRVIGETFGNAMVALTSQQMPLHNHGFNIYNQPDSAKRSNKPSPGNSLVVPTQATPFLQAAPNTTFAANMLASNGGNQPHENEQPYLALNFCMALSGAFPSFG